MKPLQQAARVALGALLAAWMGMSGCAHPEQAADEEWKTLRGPPATDTFQPGMVDGLPEPARRFFLRAIAPGTRLGHSVSLRMHGQMQLTPGGDLLDMEAEQILAPPHGYAWKARVQSGPMRIAGFDRLSGGRGEMRWWLYGLIPVVTASGHDVTRAAAGRLGGEGVLHPASLLPQRGTRWTARDAQSATFEMRVGTESVTSTLEVDDVGRVTRVTIQRWRPGEDGKPGSYQPFVVDRWSNERTFGGYTIQATFRAGWNLGGPGEFPFFHATIDDAQYGDGEQPVAPPASHAAAPG